MATTAAVVQVLGTLGSTGMQAYQLAQTPMTPMKLPTPQTQDTSQFARALLPSQKANAAATVGGGISPEFLAGLVGQESGPEGALSILGDIRRSLGPGQQAP